MHRFAIGTILCSFVVLCACDRWPPHQQDVVDHFNENDTKIFALRTKLVASEYSIVSVLIDDTVIAHAYDESIGENRAIDAEALQDADQWVELFSDTHVTFIGYSRHDRTSVVAGLFYYSGHFDDATHWATEYIHNLKLLDSVAVCSRKKPVIESGACAVELSDDW